MPDSASANDVLAGLPAFVERVSSALDRLAAAIESQNELIQRDRTCSGCLGTGKNYSGHRCVPCGGTGWRIPPPSGVPKEGV